MAFIATTQRPFLLWNHRAFCFLPLKACRQLTVDRPQYFAHSKRQMTKHQESHLHRLLEPLQLKERCAVVVTESRVFMKEEGAIWAPTTVLGVADSSLKWEWKMLEEPS
mmetsp:Transcript_10644/g.25709  ORF Transcript_10644/g.25709 Transcript_10644/m.25709 type:complete len:109 (-) Transcript_10644:1425-1751(-)